MAKTIVQETSPNLIGQVSPEFELNAFEAAVWNKGYDVIIEQAFKCPCCTYDNTPLTNCQNCLGVGWIFINPMQTKGIITSINTDTKFKSWTQESIGTVSLTVMHKNRVSLMDRVTLVNNTVIENKSNFSDIVQVRDLEGSPFVFLAYKPIDIIGIYAFNGITNPLIKIPSTGYNISSDNGYVLNITYDLTSISDFNGAITVLYSHQIQYHVLDIPHDVRNSYIVNDDGKESQITLPINAYARKAHNVLEVANRDGTGVIDNSDTTTVITASSITITSDSVNVDTSGGSI